MEQKGDRDEELPSAETIQRRLNEMGYTLKRAVKAKPQKRIPKTDAIFEQIHQVNQRADADPYTLRISIDAKVAVNVGEFERGGKTWTPTVALDHHFEVKSGHRIGFYLISYLYYATPNEGRCIIVG